MGTCVAVALTTTNPANADLHEAVQRLAEAWRAVGASVVVDKSRFLADDRDERHPISMVLPNLPEGECTTVVILGARGLGFRVRPLPAKSDLSNARTDELGEDSSSIASVAGAVAVERCGRQESPPRRLIVSTSSGRGAIETVVARSAEPLPPLHKVLPDRAGGPPSRPSELDTMPPMPSAERRAEIAEARARRDGAIATARAIWRAGADGTGGAQATLAAHLDKLASEGMRLLNFNVEAQCTPSRAALMTGRYAIRTGNGTVPLETPLYGLTQWEYTMAKMLADTGYATGMYGKWHLGHTKGRFPTDQGFDEWYGIPNSSDEATWPDNSRYRPDSHPFAKPERRGFYAECPDIR